jgi:hypothetical protein
MSSVHRNAESRLCRHGTETAQKAIRYCLLRGVESCSAEIVKRRSCRFGVGNNEKHAATRSLAAHLCYSSRIFPSVYKACALFARLKN